MDGKLGSFAETTTGVHHTPATFLTGALSAQNWQGQPSSSQPGSEPTTLPTTIQPCNNDSTEVSLVDTPIVLHDPATYDYHQTNKAPTKLLCNVDISSQDDVAGSLFNFSRMITAYNII